MHKGLFPLVFCLSIILPTLEALAFTSETSDPVTGSSSACSCPTYDRTAGEAPPPADYVPKKLLDARWLQDVGIKTDCDPLQCTTCTVLVLFRSRGKTIGREMERGCQSSE